VTDQAVRTRHARANGRGAGKSAEAFRTISEVSDELDVPQHVLRFWETKFSQVRPMKRGGGRRYYRPDDIELLRRIRDLLYREGYTIKGVQKLLRENRTAEAAGAGAAAGAAASGAPAGTSAATPDGAPGDAPGAPGAAGAAAGAAPDGRIDPQVRAELESLRRELVELRGLLQRALDR
jgi:DNA-binding transcriptional MerR regulator